MKRLFLLLFLASSCTSPKGSVGMDSAALANQFMQTYYEAANLDAALAISGDLAREKILKEKELGGGQAASENLSSRKVRFRIEKDKTQKEGEGREVRYFRLSIESGLSQPIEKLVRLSLEKTPPENATSAGLWRVVNFIEQ